MLAIYSQQQHAEHMAGEQEHGQCAMNWAVVHEAHAHGTI